MARQVDKYYCPTCRLDPNNKITFEKKVTAAQKAEIMKTILKNDPISKKPIPKKCKKNPKKSKKTKADVETAQKNAKKSSPNVAKKQSPSLLKQKADISVTETKIVKKTLQICRKKCVYSNNISEKIP